jgi:hypothetical protein
MVIVSLTRPRGSSTIDQSCNLGCTQASPDRQQDDHAITRSKPGMTSVREHAVQN